LNIPAGFDVLLVPFIEIDDRFSFLMSEKWINRFSIMSGIEKHFIERAQGETLRKLD
jgi:hypothetical protein